MPMTIHHTLKTLPSPSYAHSLCRGGVGEEVEKRSMENGKSGIENRERKRPIDDSRQTIDNVQQGCQDLKSSISKIDFGGLIEPANNSVSSVGRLARAVYDGRRCRVWRPNLHSIFTNPGRRSTIVHRLSFIDLLEIPPSP